MKTHNTQREKHTENTHKGTHTHKHSDSVVVQHTRHMQEDDKRMIQLLLYHVSYPVPVCYDTCIKEAGLVSIGQSWDFETRNVGKLAALSASTL